MIENSKDCKMQISNFVCFENLNLFTILLFQFVVKIISTVLF
jgi:hypothetical protein